MQEQRRVDEFGRSGHDPNPLGMESAPLPRRYPRSATVLQLPRGPCLGTRAADCRRGVRRLGERRPASRRGAEEAVSSRGSSHPFQLNCPSLSIEQAILTHLQTTPPLLISLALNISSTPISCRGIGISSSNVIFAVRPSIKGGSRPEAKAGSGLGLGPPSSSMPRLE